MIDKILGTDIYHENVGAGPALLFVHGLGATGNVWHAQRAGLQKFFKVITMDLPGSGQSAKSEPSYTMERWADQLAGLVDHLHFDRFVLIGHSMSTVLAQKFAARHPTRLSGLVLCAPFTELAAAAQEFFRKRVESVRQEGMGAVADAVCASALTPATREANPALAGLVREMLLANHPSCYAAQCEALIQGSARADQPRIQCPTLILTGDQDAVTPLASARAIAAAVPSAQIKIVPATAHLTMLERPELFNGILINWLAGLNLQ